MSDLAEKILMRFGEGVTSIEQAQIAASELGISRGSKVNNKALHMLMICKSGIKNANAIVAMLDANLILPDAIREYPNLFHNVLDHHFKDSVKITKAMLNAGIDLDANYGWSTPGIKIVAGFYYANSEPEEKRIMVELASILINAGLKQPKDFDPVTENEEMFYAYIQKELITKSVCDLSEDLCVSSGKKRPSL